MTQETVKKVWIGGIYSWPASSTKEERRKGGYARHNWCDIDTDNVENYNAVLAVFKKYQVDVISQRVGRGWHMFGDLVEYDLWKQIWIEIKPYADPLWSPHTLRVTKKRKDELWSRPIYHKHKNDPQNWAKSIMAFLCKTLRDENSSNIWTAMHSVGLHKYFQVTVYGVELK
jgi:hypothetical protein